MRLLGSATERLLLLLFGAARAAFLLGGVAFGCAWLAARAAAPADTPAWLRDALISALLISATFGVAGLLLVAARRWRVPHQSGGHEPARGWPVLLAFSLLALSAGAAHVAAGLLPLWSEIGVRLAAIGFWDGLTRSDAYGGIVLLPILLALFVPALVTAAAFCGGMTPLLLLPSLATRSRRFPMLLALATICQAAFVLSGWLAADAFGRLAEQAVALMNTAKDTEVLQLAGELRGVTGILTATATALIAPLLGMLAWLAFLRPSGAAAGFFTESASAAAAPRAAQPQSVALRLAALPAREPPVASRGPARPPPARPQRAPARRARLALAVLGALMLAFALADGLRMRAAYVSSLPEPGTTLAASPAVVRVSFGAALDPASSLSLTRLVLPPYTGEQPQDVEISRRIAPDDPEGRTLEAVPPVLPAGLYRVEWQALPAGGGVPRFGSFSFGVGVPVPADALGVTHSLQDRDGGARGRRHTFAGGVLLLALGALLPRLAPRT